MATTTHRSRSRASGLPPFIMSDEEVRAIPFTFEDTPSGAEEVTLTLQGRWTRRSSNRWVFSVVSSRVEQDGEVRYYPSWTDTDVTLPSNETGTIRVQATVEAFVRNPHPIARDTPVTATQPLNAQAAAMDAATTDDDGNLTE